MSDVEHVFIAGPYDHPDPVRNTREAVLVGDRLLELGMTPFVPHLSAFWHFLSPHDRQVWLDYDIRWLSRCDAIVRIGGKSPGADREMEYAKANGICHLGVDSLLG